MPNIAILGDLNLMGVADPQEPFRQLRGVLHACDFVFANLECVLSRGPGKGEWGVEGYFADPEVAGKCLADGGVTAVGMANNMTYGGEEIIQSVEVLDRHDIAHTGAGRDRAAALKPVIAERGGVRFGFLQRSSVYWPSNHEATEKGPGIAVLRGHTAYEVPTVRVAGHNPPVNRPGIGPIIRTWANRDHLRQSQDDIARLRKECDVVIASFHWGLDRDVLEYMTEIGHAAIDAGADVVIGGGPHFPLAIEVYRSKPIFYGLGCFSFDTDKVPLAHRHWVGEFVKLAFDRAVLKQVSFELVTRNQRNETVVCSLAEEEKEIAVIAKASVALGTKLTRQGDTVVVSLA